MVSGFLGDSVSLGVMVWHGVMMICCHGDMVSGCQGVATRPVLLTCILAMMDELSIVSRNCSIGLFALAPGLAWGRGQG